VIPDLFNIGGEFLDTVDWNLLGVWFAAFATLLGAIGTVGAVFVGLNQAKQARAAAAGLCPEPARSNIITLIPHTRHHVLPGYAYR
jgi:hypothetical protein